MIKEINIIRNKNQKLQSLTDVVAIEEPLEIQLEIGKKGARKTQSLSVTMRTPGNDEELAIGFLFTEALINSRENLSEMPSFIPVENKIIIRLNENFDANLDKVKRNFYTTSSCGVCGKESIEAIHQVCPVIPEKTKIEIDVEVISTLPEKLFKVQETFASTGGIHAAALFNLDGQLIAFREDVGRHNALDKVIGTAFLEAENSPLQLHNRILLLSGRASFELIQKAAMAGIKVVCAIGAPSSLAVETAASFDMTLIGFLKNASCNIYSGEKRIKID